REQCLYWAWEVLMPGVPFDQGVTTVPFKRIRAIVILTDGAQVGGAGDAYKGRFGFQEGAAYNTDPDHGTIMIRQPTTDGTYDSPLTNPLISVPNNLNARALQLADNIKHDGVNGIKIYVIAFNLAGNTAALNFLDEIASDPDQNGEYFLNAPQPSDLGAIFKEIAASLSNPR